MIKFNLKQILKNRNLTLSELSELTGISTNSLGALANGKSNGIQFPTLTKILDATGCRVEDLIHNVGSLYTISIPENLNDHSPFTDFEKKSFMYDILLKNEDTGTKSLLTIHVSVSLNTINYPKSDLTRTSIHFVFKDLTFKNESDENLSTFINHPDDSLMIALANLIVTEFMINYRNEDINHNSSILFSWFGFPNIPRSSYDVLIQAMPFEITFADESSTASVIDTITPFISDIKSLKHSFANIDDVTHDVETGKTSISIYSK